ncbi:MAG: archaeal heat shock protein Hsp20 [Nitrososphaeraceae archaeon]
MSFWDIEPSDWFKKYFQGRSGFDDVFKSFDEMRSRMEREFEEGFKQFESSAPKDLVREYETPEGAKVREYGPFVYGYSMTVGPDGRPKVREFGNVKSPFREGRGGFRTRPLISSEREPLVDISTTDKEIKVVIEMPGVNKENIKINAYDSTLEVTTTDAEGKARRYHERIELPEEADLATAKSKYNNGILEITFNKKDKAKHKGKEIKIE